MGMTDPVADLLTRIRNSLVARHNAATVPYSRVKAEIVKVLNEEGYISGFKVDEKKTFAMLTIELKYDSNSEPAIRSLKRISKPGRRVYSGKDEIPQVLAGMGINILSTSRGILTGKRAREQGVGGEILCEIS